MPTSPDPAVPPLDGAEQRAAEALPRIVYDYYATGAGDEVSAREAVAAWRSWRLLPRVLRDVSTVDTALELLGTPLTSPVLAAPTALQVMAHPQGEVATAIGVRDAGSLLVLSARSGRPIERVAAAAGPWWYQVYVLRDRRLTVEQVERAVGAGARALVLTVDAPYVATKPRVIAPLPLPDDHARRHAAGSRDAGWEQDPSIGWEAVDWLRTISGLPVVVKGVLHPHDAARCVRHGAAAVIVSNHGGRQLDRAVATAHALAPVVRAVHGRIPVLVDGGIRTGADVLTALALGACAVLVGRPVLWALADGGAPAVRSCFDAYRTELREAMALAGLGALAQVDADLLAGGPTPPVGRAG